MNEFDQGESDDLSIRGEIETSSVPDLLRSLLASKETGILTFRNGEVTKSVYMHEGRIVQAASTDPDERLGESLLYRGKITARDYREASKLIRPGRRLGAILIELKAIEPDDLISSLEEQIKDIVVDLLTWTRGEYELIIKEMNPADLLPISVATENLIIEGIRRSRSWSTLMKAIGSIKTVPVLTEKTDVTMRLELSEDEQQVLGHVNGRSTVEQICQMSYLSDFETCRILWALQVLGVVRWAKASDVETQGEGARAEEEALDLEGVVEKFNQMFNRVYVFLRGRVGEDVNVFMDEALEQVCRQFGALFDGVDLKDYGRADYEQMLANVADLPAEQRRRLMVSALNELVFVIQLSVRQKYGVEEQAVVSGIIKDGFRKLGV